MVSCSPNNIENETIDHKQLSFISNLATNEPVNQVWKIGDKIGVYAVKSGKDLTAGNIFNNSNNRAYQINKLTYFTSSDPIILNHTALDIRAYSPYQTGVDNFKIVLDITNQSNQKELDFLYSNNSVNITKSTNRPTLNFQHKLTKLLFIISKGEGVASLDHIKVKSLSGLNTKGFLNLDNGAIEVAPSKKEITNITIKDFHEAKLVELILLPNQQLSNAILKLELNNVLYTWQGSQIDLIPGKKYTYKLELSKEDGIPQVTTLEPTGSIKDWELGYEGDIGTLTPDKAEETLLFFETYDKLHKVQKDENYNYPTVNEFKQYDNKEFSFSDTTGNVDIRSTNRYPNFVWFPSNRDAELNIEGFGFKNLSNVRMQIKVTIDINDKKGDFDTQNIKITFDGEPWAFPSRVLTREETNNNKFYALEFDNLPNDFNTMKFEIKAKENHGIRLGNISIWGIQQ